MPNVGVLEPVGVDGGGLRCRFLVVGMSGTSSLELRGMMIVDERFVVIE